MNILAKLLPAKTAITSDTIRTRVADAESEIAAHRAKISGALAGVAAMNDAEHVKIESEIAATKRAITRLESLIAHLNAELPATIEAEEAAAKASADEALRQRAEALRTANTVEAENLLADYKKLASRLGDILARLDEIAAETNAVNAELHKNQVVDGVLGFADVHRKHPRGHYELPLSGIILPPAFAGGKAAWPRQ